MKNEFVLQPDQAGAVGPERQHEDSRYARLDRDHGSLAERGGDQDHQNAIAARHGSIQNGFK